MANHPAARRRRQPTPDEDHLLADLRDYLVLK
jgi:hypothetical protein